MACLDYLLHWPTIAHVSGLSHVSLAIRETIKLSNSVPTEGNKFNHLDLFTCEVTHSIFLSVLSLVNDMYWSIIGTLH